MSSGVTLRDVAAVAGVSVSAVSKVLNGRGSFSPDTQQRILEAADRLNFRPNALARSFATGRSQLIGVLAEYAPGMFTMPVLVGASAYLGSHELATLFMDASRSRDAMREMAHQLQARRIDGLLVVGDGLSERLASVSNGLDVPVVYAYGDSMDSADVSFVPDNHMAGRIATEYLIDHGRSAIAHIGVPADIAGQARTAGCLSALGDHGLTLAGGRMFESPWRRAGGVAAAEELLSTGTPFDAIFCANDQIAFGAMSALIAAGLRVPDDVALVGVDNWEAMTGTGPNVLTTIDLDLRGLGEQAARYLRHALTGSFEPGTHAHPCRLKVGETA